MDVTEELHGRVAVVTARGRLDGATSGIFAERLERLASAAQPRLVVDFSGVDFISSAGLRAVLTLAKKIKAGNGALALCAVQAPVLEVLDITSFSTMIDIHSDLAAALAALA
jgi:anti-anti-sigma factor